MSITQNAKTHKPYAWLVCNNCGADIGEDLEEYISLRKDLYTHSEALEVLQINTTCCVIDIMRPGLIAQPPTKRDHEEQKALLTNLEKRKLGYNMLMGSINVFSALPEGARSIAESAPKGEDSAFDDMIAGILEDEEPIGIPGANEPQKLLHEVIQEPQKTRKKPLPKEHAVPSQVNGPRAVAAKGTGKRKPLRRIRK